LVEEQPGAVPVDRLRRVLTVGPRGMQAIRNRPASRRRGSDMLGSAHIKDRSRQSRGGCRLTNRWPAADPRTALQRDRLLDSRKQPLAEPAPNAEMDRDPPAAMAIAARRS
jgi:hypothetical protein